MLTFLANENEKSRGN